MSDNSKADLATIEREAKDIKAQELADLEAIDLGIDGETGLLIKARERKEQAVTAMVLRERILNLKATVAANKGVGSESQATQFQKQLDEVSAQYYHCLRSIKGIDERYPGAKAKMNEIPTR